MEGASSASGGDTPKEEKPPKLEGDGGGGSGVAEKDIDKIAKLKEFMAKQQIDEKDLPRSYRGKKYGWYEGEITHYGEFFGIKRSKKY